MTLAVILGLAVAAVMWFSEIIHDGRKMKRLSLAGRIAAVTYMLWLLIFWRDRVGHPFIGVCSLILVALVTIAETRKHPKKTRSSQR